jgi:plasmid stabilization system protein ParE
MKLEFSPLARMDLLAILHFIAEDKPKAAIRFVSEIEYRCNLLSQFPNLGTSRDDLIIGLRVFAFRSYGNYYRQQEEVLRIERVLSPGLEISLEKFQIE